MPPYNYTTRALCVVRDGKKYGAQLEEQAVRPLRSGEVLVRMIAAGFNHRDLWIRKGQYGRIGVGCTYGSDGCGIVVDSTVKGDVLLNRRVFISPMVGWDKSPYGPESKFGILGGTKFPDVGTMSELVVVERSQVLEAPHYLKDTEVAAWPLAGLTAWRAIKIKARLSTGCGANVLITGIGGGVALTALQLCVAMGLSVFVTSGDETKIQRAIAMGAKGGVNYKSDKWAKELQSLLSDELLDAVIDSAGGDIISNLNNVLKPGATVVCYGMTSTPTIVFTMRDVLKNVELKGSTMGSREELIEATAFLSEHKIVPVVSCVLDGLEAAEDGFRQMDAGSQFGKIIIKINPKVPSKL